MLETIKRSPEIFPESPKILRLNEQGIVGLTQEQACCIVILGMFKLFPYSGGRRNGGLRPASNFGALVSVTIGSPANLVLMICIMHYLLRLSRNPPRPGRIICITRRAIIPQMHDIEWWLNNENALSTVEVKEGKIEDDTDAIYHAGSSFPEQCRAFRPLCLMPFFS